MRPIVSIVGKSQAGKTVLIERLITEFKQRGYRIATIKHSRLSLEIDQPGKDSWKFDQAGSDAVAIASANKLTFMKRMEHDPGIEEVVYPIGSDFDLILIEGFREAKVPKIEVHRSELGGDLLCSPQELSAIASDEPLEADVPLLSLDDTPAIADFIEENFLFHGEEETSLFVNGKPIAINPFVQQIIARTALAIISTLKGIGEIWNFDISVRKNR